MGIQQSALPQVHSPQFPAEYTTLNKTHPSILSQNTPHVSPARRPKPGIITFLHLPIQQSRQSSSELGIYYPCLIRSHAHVFLLVARMQAEDFRKNQTQGHIFPHYYSAPIILHMRCNAVSPESSPIQSLVIQPVEFCARITRN